MKILITYGSKYGSTRSIAERIHDRLAAANIGEVTLAPFDKKLSINDFDVLILGSCIHMQSWIRPSKKFIKRNADALQKNPKPTWAFSVGMPPDDQVEKEAKVMEKWLRKYVPLRGHTLFQGMVNEQDVGGCFKLFFSCFGGKFEDKRKWNLMDDWADGIVQELRVDQQNAGLGN
ncbi:hypothetical protein EG329_013397 [Mollisiaceae sp. DMI_Dod_QoI]|nr:hypothetical protein EG329_013397 [Helotiales sp. DMI_Dod_QoI]